MSVRDERAAAQRRWRRRLEDDFTAALPGLLDEFDAIGCKHTVPGGIVPAVMPGGFAPDVMTDEEAAEFAEKWQAANPAIGVRVKPETVAAPAGQAAAPAKPAPRRRTARKDGE